MEQALGHIDDPAVLQKLQDAVRILRRTFALYP